MQKTIFPTTTLLLIDPSVARTKQAAAVISTSHRFEVLAFCRSFEDAYNIVESERPGVVLIAAELLAHPGFPMFKALLEGVGIQATILCPSHTDSSRYQSFGQVVITDDNFCYLDLLETLAGAPVEPRCNPSGRLVRTRSKKNNLVVIGASTGGVEALTTVLSHYPADAPPTLVVQHIGHEFVSGFARRLNRLSLASVTEAKDGANIEIGQVQIAPGAAAHLTLASHGWKCRLKSGPPVSGHQPSVDALFNSVARLGASVVAVLLTGMGRDGAEGMVNIRNSGGHTIGQDERTSVVYGMPRVAYQLGGVVEQLPIERIGPAILAATNSYLERGPTQ